MLKAIKNYSLFLILKVKCKDPEHVDVIQMVAQRGYNV